MTTTKLTVNESISNVVDAADAIAYNARVMQALCGDRHGWEGQHPATHRRLLMQMRHDLENALESVKALEEKA